MWSEPNLSDEAPRAPDQATWDAMSPAERKRAVDALPTYMHDAAPPEGEFHAEACDLARDTLREFFKTRSPGVHVGSDLPVYYPDEPQFSPDLFVVFDVAPGKRTRWVVIQEGKGLDFVLEVIHHGNRAKDLTENVVRYARLKIPEYFIYDLERGRITGYQLAEGNPARYVPILPQFGHYTSRVLGMDLVLEADGLQFYNNNARLLSPPELALRLKETLGVVEGRLAEEQRAREEAQCAEEQARHAEEQARHAEEQARHAEEQARHAEEQARHAEEQARSAQAEEQRARLAAEERLAEALIELERLKAR